MRNHRLLLSVGERERKRERERGWPNKLVGLRKFHQIERTYWKRKIIVHAYIISHTSVKKKEMYYLSMFLTPHYEIVIKNMEKEIVTSCIP